MSDFYPPEAYPPGTQTNPFLSPPGGGTPPAYAGGEYDPNSGQRYASDYNPWTRNWGSQPAIPTRDYLEGQRTYGDQQAANWGIGQNMYGAALAQNERAGYAGGILGAEAGYGLGSRWLNTDAGFDRRRLANEQGRLDVDVAANARQPGYLTALHDLALRGMNAQAGQQRRGLESNLTSRGAFTSVGGQQGRFDIASELLRQTQGENTQFGERMAQVGDQKQKLDLAAKDLGISGEQLESDLQKGLERLGLDRDLTVADLMNKMSSSNIQEAMQARQVVQDAVANYSDYFQRFYPGAHAAAGVYDPALGAGPSERPYGGGGVRVR